MAMKKGMIFVLDILIGLLAFMMIFALIGFFEAQKTISHTDKIQRWRTLQDAIVITSGKLIENFEDPDKAMQEFQKVIGTNKFMMSIERFNSNFDFVGGFTGGSLPYPDYPVISEKYYYYDSYYYIIRVSLW